MSDLSYYYCSMSTFVNIINNKQIWMAEPSKQNDSEELTWFTNYILPYVAPELFKKGNFKFFVNDLVNGFPTQYISCFTINDGDKLSCWRGYGDDGQGVSIGFDLDKIVESHSALRKEKIIYLPNPKEKNENRKALKEAKEDILTDLNDILYANNNSLMSPDMAYEAIHKAIKYKNIAFKEEQEERLIYDITNDSTPLQVFYRSTQNNLLRYVKMPIPEKCIGKIVIGPRCAADEQTIREFVQKINDSSMIELSFSKASYRKV